MNKENRLERTRDPTHEQIDFEEEADCRSSGENKRAKASSSKKNSYAKKETTGYLMLPPFLG